MQYDFMKHNPSTFTYVEKAESLQEVELKNSSKKIRAEQERELKSFRESLKTELKLLKQEIDLLPKAISVVLSQTERIVFV
ncbi:hypothetical protein E2C01_068853 [Portunus trituberculatus]|uniref:Uncharacterized protein n=1 Tax=Portunus trituberculatus TaxID=210409 RepID=A0A5B7HX20_PORTR|nr:hypothetical protein [Portunus trituberculatus]